MRLCAGQDLQSRSGELQDLKIADGRTIYEPWASSTSPSPPEPRESTASPWRGPSPEPPIRSRSRICGPGSSYVLPGAGYGAQGGTAEDVKYAFNEKGHGAIVNSSRGIMCAWKKTGGDGHDFQELRETPPLP